jgi:hypothetical protein
MDAKTALRRRIEGDQVVIPCLQETGLWVRPRKFSVQARDELNALLFPRRALLSKIRREQGQQADEEAVGDIDPALLALADAMRLQLRHGIAEHGFAGQGIPPDEEWISSVLDDPELAQEIIVIIQDFNRPLARGSSESSKTPPNGAFGGSDSGS